MKISDLIKEQLSVALASKLSVRLGESEQNISEAFQYVVPLIIKDLIHSPSVYLILEMIKELPYRTLLEDLSETELYNSESEKIFNLWYSKNVYVDKVENISQTTGIHFKSSEAIFIIIFRAVIANLGKYAENHALNSKEMKTILKNEFIEITPSTTSVFEISTQNEILQENILKWLIPLILLLVAGWFTWKTYTTETEPVMHETVAIKRYKDSVLKHIDSLKNNKEQTLLNKDSKDTIK